MDLPWHRLRALVTGRSPGIGAGIASVLAQEWAVGGIDVLVNNAGGKTAPGNSAWFDVGWDDWAATYE